MGGTKQPPLTTTGVAPWAFENKSRGSGPLTSMGGASGSGLPKLPTGGPGPAKGSLASAAPSLTTFKEEGDAEDKNVSGLDRVREYMKRLNPTPDAPGDGASWEAALMAE